jgi:putative hemolysin
MCLHSPVYTSLAAAVLVLALAACASKPAVPAKPAPAWFSSIGTVYPASSFIAVQGDGESLAEAESQAQAGIARYFVSRIQAKTSRLYQSTETQQDTDTRKTFSQDTFISSSIKLFTLRLVQNPWQDPGTKTWYSLAYINRAEAWAVYKDQAKAELDKFLALAAEAEKMSMQDPLKRCFALNDALKTASSDEYQQTMLFGSILSSKNMDALLAPAREKEAALQGEKAEARQNVVLTLQCSSDFESLLKNAVSAALADAGFSATASAGPDSYTVHVVVDESVSQTDMGTYYMPKAQVRITNSAGVNEFICPVNAKKAGAMSPDVAKRRAYTALAEALKTELTKKL